MVHWGLLLMRAPIVRGSRGFTLVELAVVAAVLAAVMVIAFPHLGQVLGSRRVDIAARLITTDLRQIQQLGINDATGVNIYKATFSPGSGEYVLGRNSTVLRTASLPPGVIITAASFSSSSHQVRFKGGSPAPDPGGGTITVRDVQSKRERSVVVMGATGRVRVK